MGDGRTTFILINELLQENLIGQGKRCAKTWTGKWCQKKKTASLEMQSFKWQSEGCVKNYKAQPGSQGHLEIIFYLVSQKNGNRIGQSKESAIYVNHAVKSRTYTRFLGETELNEAFTLLKHLPSFQATSSANCSCNLEAVVAEAAGVEGVARLNTFLSWFLNHCQRPTSGSMVECSYHCRLHAQRDQRQSEWRISLDKTPVEYPLPLKQSF